MNLLTLLPDKNNKINLYFSQSRENSKSTFFLILTGQNIIILCFSDCYMSGKGGVGRRAVGK